MELIRAGRASLDKPGHIDKYTLHVVSDLSSLLAGVGRAENLPEPAVIAAEIVEDLEAALAQFSEIAASLGEKPDA